MAITLQGSIILVQYVAGDPKGNSLSNPWTLDDIVNMGFPGVSKDGNIYTFFEKSIYVQNDGFLLCTDSIIRLTGVTTDYYRFCDKGTGTIQLGLFENNRYSKGCIIDAGNVLGSGGGIIQFRYLYDSVIRGAYSGTGYLMNRLNFTKIRGSKIMAGGTETNFSWLVDYEDSIISSCYYGTRSPVNGSKFKNTIIENCTIGALFYISSGSSLSRVKFKYNTVGLRNQAYGNRNSINEIISCKFEGNGVDIDNLFYTGTTTQDTRAILTIKEYFNIKVIDSEGNYLQSARVRLYNNLDELIFDELTDVNGEIPEQKLTRYIYKTERLSPDFISITTNTNYNPFTLIIEYEGKTSYISKFDILEEYNAIVSLLDPFYVDREIQGEILAEEIQGEIPETEIQGEILEEEILGVILTD